MEEVKKAISELLSGRWNPDKQEAFNQLILKLCSAGDIVGISATFCADLAAEKILPILSNPITAAYRVEGILLAKELLKTLPEHEKVLYKDLAEWRRGMPVSSTVRDQAMNIIRWGLEKYGLEKFKDIIKERIVYTSREYKICRELMENCPYLYKVGTTKGRTNYLFDPRGFTKVEKLILDLWSFLKSQELKELIERRKREIKVTEKEREELRKFAELMKDFIRSEKEVLEDRLKELEDYVDLDEFRIWLWLDDIKSLRAKLGKPVPKDEADFINMKLREGFKPPAKEEILALPPELAKYLKTPE